MARAAELLITIDRAGGTALRAQLEGELRAAIRTARLSPGDRLPSSRMLAADLGLSRGVVQECYEQLRAEGYLVTRTGSVTVVADGVAPDRAVEPPVRGAQPAGGTPTPARPVADFVSGVPDLG